MALAVDSTRLDHVEAHVRDVQLGPAQQLALVRGVVDVGDRLDLPAVRHVLGQALREPLRLVLHRRPLGQHPGEPASDAQAPAVDHVRVLVGDQRGQPALAVDAGLVDDRVIQVDDVLQAAGEVVGRDVVIVGEDDRRLRPRLGADDLADARMDLLGDLAGQGGRLFEALVEDDDEVLGLELAPTHFRVVETVGELRAGRHRRQDQSRPNDQAVACYPHRHTPRPPPVYPLRPYGTRDGALAASVTRYMPARQSRLTRRHTES